MADYFTNFSCELKVASSEDTARALEIYNALKTEGDDDYGRVDFVASVDLEDPHTILIYDDVSGEPEHVIPFVLQCARELKLTGFWGFEWSYSCSRPQLNAFGGAGVVLDLATGETVAELSTHQWLQAHLSMEGDRRGREDGPTDP
ncbi:hypothetical protein [Asticcacaulis sp. W401b]|uniref:hypothetical protein n=1 Tax=Asticcacaulis sp. W401b TaxID=3388666 RepID=UPI003970714F